MNYKRFSMYALQLAPISAFSDSPKASILIQIEHFAANDLEIFPFIFVEAYPTRLA